MRASIVIASAALLLATPAAFAGIGKVHDNGSLGVIDITVDFGWESTDEEFEYLKMELTKASEILWDATDGQLRLGTVTFHQMAANPTVADIYIEQGNTQPHSSGVGVIGSQAHVVRAYYDVFFQLPQWQTGLILAHELGHYALGLYDEYRPSGFVPTCDTYGPCFRDQGDEGVQMDHENNCIMHPSTYRVGGNFFGSSELCVAQNHDLDLTCGPDDFGYDAGRETQQTKWEGQSCFETLAQNFSFVQLPGGLPDATPPPNFVAPAFIDHRDYPEAIMLVLDRSGSMALSTEDDWHEVCGNGFDDDYDGQVDEADCTGARIDYMKAASRLFLDLALGTEHPVEVGVISYETYANVEHPLSVLDASSLGAMKQAIDALKPLGVTASGDALDIAHQELVGKKDALRSVVHFTDGYWNWGQDPLSVVQAMAQDEILVHSIGTGPAVNADYLAQMSEESFGYPISERSGDALPSAFANTWSRVFGRTAIIPKLPFHTNTKRNNPEIPDEHRMEGDAWFTGKTEMHKIPDGAEKNSIGFTLPDGAESMVIVLAGSLSDMSGFDLDGQVISPNGDTCRIAAPQGNCRVIQDPYYNLLILDRPIGGGWQLDLWSGSRGTEQTGYASVHYHAPNQGLRVDIAEKAISTQDRAIVQINPTYATTLYELAGLEVSVEDPVGGVQSFPVQESEGGGYFAEISGLQYRGLHKVSVLARTGMNTFNHPGESWTKAPSNSVNIPSFSIGAQIAFSTVDGWTAGDSIGDVER